MNTFSSLVESLKADILKLETAEGVAPEVIQRLKQTSRMNESAAKNQKLAFATSLQQDVILIDNFLVELNNSQNDDLIKILTEADEVK